MDGIASFAGLWAAEVLHSPGPRPSGRFKRYFLLSVAQFEKQTWGVFFFIIALMKLR